MSKNIEEIVESVLPDSLMTNDETNLSLGQNNGVEDSRKALKQAITEGKLVAPLSVEITAKLINEFLERRHGLKYDGVLALDLSKAICKAQFGGNK